LYREGLLTTVPQNPTNGIRNVGLATAVWTNDTGNPSRKIYFQFVGERFKAVDFDFLEDHSIRDYHLFKIKPSEFAWFLLFISSLPSSL